MRYRSKLLGILSKVLILSVFLVALLSLPPVSTIHAADDHANSRERATAIDTRGRAVSGRIDRIGTLGDSDWFKFETKRGRGYTINLELVGRGEQALQDADFKVMNAIRQGAGFPDGQVESRDGNVKSIDWVARTSETYYVVIRAKTNPRTGSFYFGSYKLRIHEDVSLEDRHYPDALDQATQINFGSQYQGAISPWANKPGFSGTVMGADDYDFFYFNAERGVKYNVRVALEGLDGLTIGITLPSSDPIGKDVLLTNNGLGNELEWVAPTQGKYYVFLTGSALVRQPVGAYTLQVMADITLRDRHSDNLSEATTVNFGNYIQGAISPADDIDYFKFAAVRGVKYTIRADLSQGDAVRISVLDDGGQVEATNGGIGSTLDWLATTHGTRTISITSSVQVRDPIAGYNLRISGDNSMQDRHADARTDATPINLGIGMAASISPPGDRDYFKFSAYRGVKYTVRADLGTAPGIRMEIGKPTEGVEDAVANADGSLEWTAGRDGVYYVIASALSSQRDAVGTYNIVVDSDNAFEDRHGDSTADATTIGYGNLVSGAISPAEDRDYFEFTAIRGVRYTFKLTNQGIEALSLAVVGDGFQGGIKASNYGEGSQVVWIAPEDETYYLVVSRSPRATVDTGVYTLEVSTEDSLQDRHPGDPRDATILGTGNAISGAISPADDMDYFSYAAERSTTYTAAVELVTADAVVITVAHHDSGFSATNYGSGNTLEWTAPASETYTVLISGAAQLEDPVGIYRVTMTRGGTVPEETVATPTVVAGAETPVDATPQTPSAEVAPPPPPPVPSGARLRVSTRLGPPGSKVLVPIQLENGQQVGSIGFNVNYDPSIAHAVDVYRGSRMSPAAFSFNAAVPGLIRIGSAGHNEAKGDGSAAVIEFMILGERGRYTDITISDTEVTDTAGEPRSIEVHPGTLKVDSAVMGDGNGDGRISPLDALIAMKMFVELEDEDLVMDVNRDGRVTPGDAVEILKLARRG